LAGGVDTGFRHVEPTQYRSRLLHVKGRASAMSATEVERAAASLNAGDVFVLDCGLKLVQWNGKDCGVQEKMVRFVQIIANLLFVFILCVFRKRENWCER
jgi:hypothetical protein